MMFVRLRELIFYATDDRSNVPTNRLLSFDLILTMVQPAGADRHAIGHVGIRSLPFIFSS